MDIYSYIRKDHRRISQLMEKVLVAESPGTRLDMFEEVKRELDLHTQAEQATFYSALGLAQRTRENIEDAEDDHAEIRDFILRLTGKSTQSEKWLELFGEFKHAVEHHVKLEEDRIFEKARKILNGEEAEALAEDMQRMKLAIPMRESA